jgi:hypothetical protein
MNPVEKYFILVVVVWRLTHLISAEDGPFDIIIQLRKAAGDSFFGKLMDCFYCLSIWIGLLTACYAAGGGLIEIIILSLYYSGAAILLEKLTNKNFV